MKAIVTRYHGPGNVRGSRISATDSDGNRVYIGIEPQWNHDTSHEQAAIALCSKMGWKGQLVYGSMGPCSEVFVFMDFGTNGIPVNHVVVE